MFKNKVAVITGGVNGIGKATVEAFKEAGAKVCIIDIVENSYFTGDIAKKEVLESFVEKVIKDYGKIDYLINNAKPQMKGLDTCSYEDFINAMQVGVAAPFYLTKLFTPYLNKDAVIINISSTRDSMSQAQSESYSAAKGGISALTHSLAISLAHKARVNTICPGWIDTHNQTFKEPDSTQHPVGRVGKPKDIANAILFLCSDKASFITGQSLVIDGGMTKQMIYHDDNGWTYNK